MLTKKIVQLQNSPPPSLNNFSNGPSLSINLTLCVLPKNVWERLCPRRKTVRTLCPSGKKTRNNGIYRQKNLPTRLNTSTFESKLLLRQPFSLKIWPFTSPRSKKHSSTSIVFEAKFVKVVNKLLIFSASFVSLLLK